MVHAAMGSVGPLLNGPDALSNALLDVIGADGTMKVYTSWDSVHDDLLDDQGRVLHEWRGHVPGFDAQASRAVRVRSDCRVCQNHAGRPAQRKSGDFRRGGAAASALGGFLSFGVAPLGYLVAIRSVARTPTTRVTGTIGRHWPWLIGVAIASITFALTIARGVGPPG